MLLNKASIFILFHHNVGCFKQPLNEDAVSRWDNWQPGDAKDQPDHSTSPSCEEEVETFDSKNPLLPYHLWVGGLASFSNGKEAIPNIISLQFHSIITFQDFFGPAEGLSNVSGK